MILVLEDENIAGVLKGDINVFHADIRVALIVVGERDMVDRTIGRDQVGQGNVLHWLDTIAVVGGVVGRHHFDFVCFRGWVGLVGWRACCGLLRRGDGDEEKRSKEGEGLYM